PTAPSPAPASSPREAAGCSSAGQPRPPRAAPAGGPGASAPGDLPTELAEANPPAAAYKSTDPWPGVPDLQAVPALVEITATGTGERVALTVPETWIGSDAAVCDVVPPNDPYVSPRHARVSRDPQGRWVVTNNKSVN